MALRQAAKKTPYYSIQLEGPGLPTAVNTLGRWTFGVPGWRSRILVESGAERIVVYVPRGAPAELIKMIEEAVKLLGF